MTRFLKKNSLDVFLILKGTNDHEIALYLMLENLYPQLPKGSTSYIKSEIQNSHGELLERILTGAGFSLEYSAEKDIGDGVVEVEKHVKNVGYWWDGALIVLKFLENAGYHIEGYARKDTGEKLIYPNFL